jgi:DNA-directed RNA polymerase subunit M/transcription elongation factor TFIIS
VQAVTPTLVVVCSRCANFLLAKADQKTRSCPHCGYTLNLAKVKKVASARTANEASIILRKLKSDAASKGRRPRHL